MIELFVVGLGGGVAIYFIYRWMKSHDTDNGQNNINVYKLMKILSRKNDDE